MIRFRKGLTNKVVVTLTENSTLEAPVYLFRFTNQQTNVPYYFMAKDESLFLNRYNLFFVTEKANPDTCNDEVQLGNEGFYDYVVFETSLTTPNEVASADLAVPFIIKEVENGIVQVVINPVDVVKYEPQDNTAIVYQPNNQENYIILENLTGYMVMENGYLIEQEST